MQLTRVHTVECKICLCENDFWAFAQKENWICRGNRGIKLEVGLVLKITQKTYPFPRQSASSLWERDPVFLFPSTWWTGKPQAARLKRKSHLSSLMWCRAAELVDIWMKASESQQVKCFHEASLCCCAARLALCQASTAGTGVQIHHYTSSSICSKQSARGTKQLGPLIMWAASLSHHRNASCCAIHILFNLAPQTIQAWVQNGC